MSFGHEKLDVYRVEEAPASYELSEIDSDTYTDSETEVYTSRDPHFNVK